MLNDRSSKSSVSRFLPGIAEGSILLASLLMIMLNPFVSVSASRSDFQQQISYIINASLDTSSASLTGYLKVEYKNNANGSLNKLMIHLYPNAYGSRETALTKQLLELGETELFFADENERGSIDSLDFLVNGEAVKWKLSDDPDIAVIDLNTVLEPGQSLRLETPFRVKLPIADYSRLGYQNKTYYLTNWYPEIAVYDQNGWHAMPYMEQGEFYSEYASYNVDLSVPEGFKVASTGRCATGNCLEEKVKQVVSEGADTKTVSLQRDSVHSFAIFISDEFLHKEKKIKLKGEKDIRCDLFYTKDNAIFYDSAFVYVEKALTFLSELYGEYPYDEFAIVDGRSSAGVNMEYPCVTLIQSPVSFHQLEQIIVHEMAHMWNYAAVRFNEREHPWVDEGLSMFSELLYFDTFYDLDAGKGMNHYMTGSQFLDKHTGIGSLNQTQGAALEYLAASRLGSDLPPSLTSESHTLTSYGNSVYAKAGLSWYLMYNSVGEAAFSDCVQNFIYENKYQLSDPNKLKEHMESCLETDLAWFFDDLIGNDKPLDLSLNQADDDQIAISGSADNPVPVQIIYSKKNSSENEKGSWTRSSGRVDEQDFPEVSTVITVSAEPFADHRPADNMIRSNGDRPSGYSLKFLTNHGLYSDREIYWLPVAGYNTYNSLMPGISIHNYSLVPRSLEFHLTPLFDPGNSYLGGLAGITKTWRRKHSSLDLIRLNMHYRRFLYDSESVSDIESLTEDGPLGYDKVSLSMDLGFDPDEYKGTVSRKLSFIHHSVFREIITYELQDDTYIPERERKHFGFQSLTWSIMNRRTMDPYSSSIRIENGDEYMKVQLEFNYRFSFSKPAKGFDIRFHFGKFIFNEQDQYNYNFRMDGWTGADDYLFNDYYFGRTETSGLWNRQFILKDGAFKVPTAVGQSNNWNAALNLQIDNPTPVPVRFFIDIGTYAGIQDVFEDLNNVIMYDAGICISMGNGAFEVYLPLFISKDIEKELEINERNSLSDKIRFVFDIKKMNPIRLRNKIHGVSAEY